MTQGPTLTRLEYRSGEGDWVVAHAGIALLNPEKYIADLATRGIEARQFQVEWTGEPCPFCEKTLRSCRPQGSCLI